VISNLLNCIYTNFRACPSPENFLARTPVAEIGIQSETDVQKVVLAGASNLKYSVAYFSNPSFTFIDHTTPGWMPTPENIAALRDSVRIHSTQKACAFVFNLFGNT
jgi:hypothetical protein